MKILYVAKHNSGGMDDEGAVTYALRQLGHEVRTRNESDLPTSATSYATDLLLVHKPRPQDWGWLTTFKGVCPRVCWYFDRVDDPDPTTRDRSDQRVAWMGGVMPHLEYLFCTDGDWVTLTNFRSDIYPSTHYLPQGFDERLSAAQVPPKNDLRHRNKILLTCNDWGSRAPFVRKLKDRYGPRLAHYKQGLYRNALAWAARECCAVVAPDGPVSPNYCSNRAYTALGLGAYLIHPSNTPITRQYRIGYEFSGYSTEALLFALIDEALHNHTYTKEVARCGHQRTMEEHLYRHRLEELLKVVTAGTR